MLSVEEAHARLIALFGVIEPETVPLAEAGGRVLAADAVARRRQPPFRAAAMDGYALRAEDRAEGARLRVVGRSEAGRGFDGRVGPGEAVRIFTGAPVPDDADAILIQEDADPDGEAVTVRPDFGPELHIRAAGTDFEEGMRLAAGRRLGASDLSLLAAMNLPDVQVRRRPAIALIPTGNELVWPGETPGPDQIVSSNNFGLKAMLEAEGAEVRLLPIARDTIESLDAVFDLAEGADLVVTLGGASVGEHDLVREAGLRRGLDLAFYKIAMRPGKPLMVGRLGSQPLVGLPGNPVSALVCAHLFLRPAVRAMLGLSAGLPKTDLAVLACDVEANGPRTHYMRSVVERVGGRWQCRPFARQDSSLLSVLGAANALLVRPRHDVARSAGDMVEFIHF
jgi:molybdopterin molybdotransferase